MAEVAGMLASAVLEMVAQQLGSAIGGQIALHQKYNKDLREMKTTLDSLQAVLKDAERRSIKDASVRLWLERLKDAMYDISDMIEEFEADTQVPQPAAQKLSLKKHLLQLAVVIPRLIIGPKNTMANKMKMMREELGKITKQHKDFSFTGDNSSNVQQVIDTRETTSIMGDIVGRTEEKQRILASLSDSMAQKITILPIYGIGGIGKTTLAKMVFNDSHFKGYSQVWVYVSQTFDLNKIGNNIISQLSKEEILFTGMQMIQSRLRELLAGSKILIVLDDLWEDSGSQLEDLMAMLKVGEGGNVVVIVTTRDEGIARKLCTIKPYKLELLTNDTCWNIIKQKSAFDSRDDKEQLEQIGRDIATKCGGVPLAAQSLGHMLRSMTSGEWESVRDSDIWNVSTSEDTPSSQVLASLRLSYSSMPSYLKLCFAYCVVFPKGHKIVKDDLIHQWISLGFIEPSNMFSTKQLGERYIKQLLGLSFLQHSMSPLTAGVYHEDVTLFTMHDLVHEVARSVMVDEILDASKQGNTGGSSCRYALLNDCSKSLKSSTDSPAKVRALRFLDCGKIGLHNAAFSAAKSLRVLDLRECSIRKLPDSIGQLKQLRYLNAPRVQDQMIPGCITRLSKLIYLKLCESSAISALPESIGEIEGLMYLDLSGCSGIEKLPKSFGDLKKLVHLDLSNCCSVTGVSEFLGSLTELQYLNLSYCPNIGELPGALGSLSELQYLNLSFSSYLGGSPEAEVLGTLTKLEYLNLSSESSDIRKLPEALGSFDKLEYLNLSGCHKIKKLPRLFGNLKNLVHLDLYNCGKVKRVAEALGSLTKLQHLNLSYQRYRFGRETLLLRLTGLAKVMGKLTELRYLNLSNCLGVYHSGQTASQVVSDFMESISTLSKLEHLYLCRNTTIESIPESFSNLRKLHTLDLSGCYALRQLPKSLGEIDSMKILNVAGCNIQDESELDHLRSSSALLPRFVVQAGDGESGSNIFLLQHANTAYLEICRLENVKSAEEAQSIKLMEKQRLEGLKFEWTRGAERFVEDIKVLGELVPPSTLRRFQLRGYNGVSFPPWLMGISHYLPNIVHINIEDLPKCSSLPPLGQLPNLQWLRLSYMHSITKIDEGFCGGARAFPQLNAFILTSMKSLEEWNTTYSYGDFMFPNLEDLRIRHCPKLRLKPCPPRAIKYWEIERSDEVISSWGENVSHTGASSSSALVKHLQVTSCKLPLHQWRLLHHLPALQSLELCGCSDLTSSPEIIRDLSSLQSLEFTRSIPALPEGMDDLTSLKKLEISFCKGIKSLPESIQQLTNLEKLYIKGCPELKWWCESEENEKKLAHIKQKRISY